jgi:hypothetical protein
MTQKPVLRVEGGKGRMCELLPLGVQQTSTVLCSEATVYSGDHARPIKEHSSFWLKQQIASRVLIGSIKTPLFPGKAPAGLSGQ